MRILIRFAAAALLIWSAAAQAANPRIALVIGESAYPDAALPTAANDAGLVAQVLQAAGFDVIGARDLDQKSVRESFRDFLDKANAAGPDMQAFVYFSGRAFQYAGDNYLAPVDARIARDSDAPIEAVKLSDFTHALAAAPGLARVIVVDGARPNPYAQQGQPLAGGLALVDPEPNSIIAFNAAPGAVGVEDAGDYGVYAKALAGLMRQGGVDITEIFEQVRLSVNQTTQGAQLPWSAGKLSAPYFLFERGPDAPPVAKRVVQRKPIKQLPAAEAYEAVIARDRLEDYEEFLRDHSRSEQARRVEAILAARREALFWRRAVAQNSPRSYWTYLKRYPKGPHAWDAGRRLDALAARREPPRDFEVIEYDDLPPPPQRELEYADRPVYYFGGEDYGPPPPRFVELYEADEDEDWRDLPPPPPPAAAGVLPALAVAIPLIIGARAYMDHRHRDGRAPDNAAPPPQRPLGPPPLPRGVKAVEPATAPQPAPVAPAAQRTPGQVRFAPPPTSAQAGDRPPPPAPANAQAPNAPRPAVAPTPAPGAAPAPAGSPTPRPTAAPLPAPSAAPATGATPVPAGSPSPRPTASPLPKPNAAPATGATPAPAGSPAPRPTAAPLPTPSAAPAVGATPAPAGAQTPTPRPSRAPLPTPAATPAAPAASPAPRPTAAPLPTPTAAPATGATPPASGVQAPAPRPSRAPLPTPSASPAPAASPTPLRAPELRPGVEPPKPAAEPPKPKAPEAPKVEAPKPAATPHVEAPKAAPPPRAAEPPKPQPAPALRAEPPKPAAAPKVEPPRPAPPPAPRAEPPRPAPPPAPRAEPPRPAPPPVPRAEPPRPAPPPAPRIEQPRPAPPPPAPRAEPPRPAPAPAPRAEPPRPAPAPAAACGHPGQPKC